MALLWMFSLTMMLTTGATMAERRFLTPPPPLPSTQYNPTWPAIDDKGQPTIATEEEQEAGPFSDWPWWWWIAATGVFVLVVSINVLICACVCCKPKRRRGRMATQEVLDGDVEIQAPPTDFRRMESSAAKRYLHNIASVFSWGSDFEADASRAELPPSAMCGNSQQSAQGSNTIYANTQTLGIPTVAPPSRDRQSGQHYHNVG